MQSLTLLLASFIAAIGIFACGVKEKEVIVKVPAAECSCTACECMEGEDCFCKTCECKAPEQPGEEPGSTDAAGHDDGGDEGGCADSCEPDFINEETAYVEDAIDGVHPVRRAGVRHVACDRIPGRVRAI